MTGLRVAVIGAGVMGANHARVAKQLDRAALVAVVDQDLERANRLATGSDAVAVTDVGEIIDRIDLAVVATPTATHHPLALELIQHGVNVLVEKPIALEVEQADEMIDAADRAGVTLAVGHVERFNAAVAELSALLTTPIHIKATRVSPYSARISDGVVHDLMIHDIDIVLGLLGPNDHPTVVGGTSRIVHGPTDDLANAHIRFASGATAAFETSRLGQQKVRSIEITQHDNVVCADLLRQDVTVHRMSRHEYLDDDGVRYRQSSVVEIPFIDQRGEPLLRELQDVVDAVLDSRPPRVDGRAGRRALEVASLVAAAVTTDGYES